MVHSSNNINSNQENNSNYSHNLSIYYYRNRNLVIQYWSDLSISATTKLIIPATIIFIATRIYKFESLNHMVADVAPKAMQMRLHMISIDQ